MVVGVVGGQDEDTDAYQVVVGGDQAGGLDAVEVGHADVHDHDVGAGAAGKPDGLAAGAGLADDRHVGGGLDEHREGLPDQGLVVGEQYADHATPPLRGRTAATAKPPSGRGPAERVPPTLRTRSRMPTRP